MNRMDALAMIEALSNANGAPGFEDGVLEGIRQHGGHLGTVAEDCLRNLYITPHSNKDGLPMVQLDAHTDEVGFMVQAIHPNGTLRFIPLGGWVANNVGAHKVRIRNSEGRYITGIVASKPPHFLSVAERNQPADINQMVIDIGAVSAAEVVNDFKIAIGAPIVPDVAFNYDDSHDLMLGKAFDCRLGCACIIDTIKALQDKRLHVNVTGAFASQEEVGIRGAAITARKVNPDIAIVFEGCPADDTFSEPYMVQTAIKKGPMLRHIDAGMITNPRYQRFALDLARKLDIPVQEAIRTGGSTNGRAIHLSGQGVPVIVISLPVRYIHTHYGFAAFSDYENAVRLATAVVSALDEQIIKGF